MYKAIFIDIDGTLRNDDREITYKTKETIKNVREKGILVILCSGRPIITTLKISKESCASNYIITSNGAYGYDYIENKCVFKNPMRIEDCLEIYKIAKENDVNFIMNTEMGRVVLKKTSNNSDKILDVPIEEFLNKTEVMQCLIQDTSFEKIKSLRPLIEKIENVEIKNQSKSLTNINVKPRETTYCDIADIKTSKGYGIKKMCENLKIDVKDTISIGDDYNDISMFLVTGFGVAMGNANDDVKSKAKYITKSNNDEGVAEVLENLEKILKGEIVC